MKRFVLISLSLIGLSGCATPRGQTAPTALSVPPPIADNQPVQRIGLLPNGYPCTGGEDCNFNDPKLKEPPAPCPVWDHKESLFCNFSVWGFPGGNYNGVSAFGFYGNGEHKVEMHGVQVQGLTNGDAIHVHEGHPEIELDNSSMSRNGVGIEAPADTNPHISATNNSHIDANGTAIKLNPPPPQSPLVGTVNGNAQVVGTNNGTMLQNNGPPPDPTGFYQNGNKIAKTQGARISGTKVFFDAVGYSDYADIAKPIEFGKMLLRCPRAPVRTPHEFVGTLSVMNVGDTCDIVGHK
jgi:hypothetical protein